ncbi:hypothetical protein OY671_008093 [Metschnikowia pulcherrima]|nr:hypothetical protein OY671_008093 [Metschnikowia pulcherrima]
MAVMANTMTMTARERSAEYATLKASGFGPPFVVKLSFGESSLIALIGGLIGMAVTFPSARAFVNAAGTSFNNPTVFNALPPQLQGSIRSISPTSTVSTPLDPTYKPEKVNAYEVGAKFQYSNRRARTNIASFYYDSSDLQIAQFVGSRFTVLNAKSAKDYGVEVENSFQLSNSSTSGIDGTWIPHAKYAKDASIDPVSSDSRFRFAPKLSANVAPNLDQPSSDNSNSTGRVQYQYTSRQLISTASRSEQGPVSSVNANSGFKIPKWNSSVEGWVQNSFNRTYFTQSFPTPLQTGDENGYLGAPRTYGSRLRATF